MGLKAGSKLGSYEITTLIAAGGMGEVYRARDSKLGRDVALKVLPDVFARDPERVARFEREARLLAALNHPHIAAIYGLEESGPIVALVMELVEGPTLAELIGRGIPPAQALLIASQVAEALEYAHDRSVIHRDLKPANIKVRADGSVKVLDFGLAKVLSEDSAADDSGNLPTLNAVSTEAGQILGTAAYMSPEQARGQAVDKRTDIWAFGAVLYEVLTGRMAFSGATFSDTIAAVLEREPDWTALPPTIPAPLQRLLRRCLEKDVRRRMRDAADVRIEIEDVLHPPSLRPEAASVSSPVRPRMRLLVAMAVAAAILAGVAIGSYLRRSPAPESVARLSLSAPGTIQVQIAPAVSPDGRQVAFVSTNAGSRPMLWVRDLESLEPHLVPGTEDAAHPFWSPDSRSIALIANGKLSRVGVADGSVVPLTDQAAVRSEGAWSRTGVILFRLKTGGWATVPDDGGQVTPLTSDINGAWPHFLPDGVHFLFIGRTQQGSAIYVGSLGSKQAKLLMTSTFEAAYAPPGYLLFFRAGTLMAQPFDAKTLQLTGNAAPVAKGVWSVAPANHASWSVSDTGVLAYTNDSFRDTELVWFDRKGQSLGSAGPPDLLEDETPQISPDGKRVVIARDRGADEDIWLLDQPGAPPSRLTLSHGFVHAPVWLSNSRIAFQSFSSSEGKVVAKDVAPVGPETALADLPPGAFLYDVSPRYAIYSLNAANGKRDLWVLPLAGGPPTLFAHAASANNVQAQISPNGRWTAYTSYESGKDEVYVASFPTPSIKRQMSTNGGVQPRWRRDGSELFYLATDQTLMSVPVLNPETLQTGTPSGLFRTRLVAQGSLSPILDTLYDAAPDGQKFLMNVVPANLGPPYTVVLNWTAGLKQ